LRRPAGLIANHPDSRHLTKPLIRDLMKIVHGSGEVAAFSARLANPAWELLPWMHMDVGKLGAVLKDDFLTVRKK